MQGDLVLPSYGFQESIRINSMSNKTLVLRVPLGQKGATPEDVLEFGCVLGKGGSQCGL